MKALLLLIRFLTKIISLLFRKRYLVLARRLLYALINLFKKMTTTILVLTKIYCFCLMVVLLTPSVMAWQIIISMDLSPITLSLPFQMPIIENYHIALPQIIQPIMMITATWYWFAQQRFSLTYKKRNLYLIWFVLFARLTMAIYRDTFSIFPTLTSNNNLTYSMKISGCIRLIQWNCCGIRGKLPHLQSIANKFDIMCIQESLLWPHNSFWINGFKAIITSSNQRGICILIRENLISTNIDLSAFNHPFWEIQGIILSLDNDSLVLVNIYRHPNQTTPFSSYNQLFSFILNKYNIRLFLLVTLMLITLSGITIMETRQVKHYLILLTLITW